MRFDRAAVEDAIENGYAVSPDVVRQILEALDEATGELTDVRLEAIEPRYRAV